MALQPDLKCCHLVWTTYRRRRWFKIAEAAAFCERAVRAACAARGWGADMVVALPHKVHALVQVPVTMPRPAIAPLLQRQVAEALAAARLVPRGVPIWRGAGWCAVLTSPAALTVVRRQLAAEAARLGWTVVPLEPRLQGGVRVAERARGIPARRPAKLEWLA
ncbi:MAG TPA: hypothetical protein VD793_03835 [Gemmatimonadales bacterium]|nr:hypothetical protein [Gemmatimonadales bacterium]